MTVDGCGRGGLREEYGKIAVVSRRLFRRVGIAAGVLLAAAAVVVPGVGGGDSMSQGPTIKPAVRASAETPPAYVALGSSYAAGPDAVPTRLNVCFRSPDNYPNRVARAMRLRLIDVTCSGATTENIVDKPQRFLAHKQIDAVTRNTALVTVTSGGNDIDYIGRLLAMSCNNVASGVDKALGPAARSCHTGHRIAAEPTDADYAKVQRKLIQTVLEIKLRAPRARVVIVDYPPLTVAGEAACDLLPLTPEQVAQTVRIFDRLAGATALAAHETGVDLVQASVAGADHTVCSAEPWLRGFAPPIPYHPTTRGKAGVADLVVASLGGPVA